MNARRRLAGGWQAFWHGTGSTLALGLFRIAFAACLFTEVSTTRAKSVFAIAGGFHDPYVAWITPVAPATFEWMHTLQYPLIALLALGLWLRPVCGALLALQGYVFFADTLNFRNHPYFFLLLLLILLPSPAAESVSWRSLVRLARERMALLPALVGRPRPLTCQRLIQVQVCLVYVYAALHKLDARYLSGEVLAHHARDFVAGWAALLGRFVEAGTAARIEQALRAPETFWLPSLLTVALELLLPVLLWSRRTRPMALVLGTLFHLAIAFSMHIYVFSFAMIASYLLFLDPETLPARLAAALRGRPLRA